MTAWHDVVARVRGLSSRLLGRADLDRLAGSGSLASFASALSGTAYHNVSELAHRDAIDLDRQTRRIAAEHLSIIAQWCGPRVVDLSPLFEDEDRRNLRAVLRGVMGHIAPDTCVAGLLPTPALSRPALDELARQTSLSRLAATLVAWGNPYGAALGPHTNREHPSLFDLQLAVDQTFAERARPVGRRVGDAVGDFVHAIIDTSNALSALACADGIVEHDIDRLFIDGGRLITADLARLAAREKPVVARDRLARAVAGTPLAPLAAPASGDVELAILAAQLQQLRHAIRLHPLSLDVVVEYFLALRAELHDLARIIWGITMQAPRRVIAAGLVTP